MTSLSMSYTRSEITFNKLNFSNADISANKIINGNPKDVGEIRTKSSDPEEVPNVTFLRDFVKKHVQNVKKSIDKTSHMNFFYIKKII